MQERLYQSYYLLSLSFSSLEVSLSFYFLLASCEDTQSKIVAVRLASRRSMVQKSPIYALSNSVR